MKFATGYVLFKLANYFKTLRPRRNRQHFADNILKSILVQWKCLNLKKKSLKFVGTTYNIVALVQIIAWRRPSDTLLFEPVMVSLPMHICLIRPQWIYNAYLQTVAYWNVSCLCLKHSNLTMKAGAFYFHVFIKKLNVHQAINQAILLKKVFPWCRAMIVFLGSGTMIDVTKQ